MNFDEELKKSYELGNLKKTFEKYSKLVNQGKLKDSNLLIQLKCYYYAIASLRHLQNFSKSEKTPFVEIIPSESPMGDNKITKIIWNDIQWQLSFFNQEKNKNLNEIFKETDKLVDSLSLQEQVENVEWVSYLLLFAGSYYYPIGIPHPYVFDLSTKKTLDYYKKCLALQEKADFKYGMTHSLNLLSFLYEQEGDIKSAITFVKRSLNLARELNSKDRIMVSLGNLAYYELQSGNFDKSISYLKEANDLNSKIGRISHLPLFLGLIHAQKLEIELAIKFIRHAINDFDKASFEYGKAGSLNALANVYFQIGDSIKAKKLYQEILMLKEENTLEIRFKVLYRLMEIAIEEKDREMAIKYKNDLFDFYTSTKNKKVIFYKSMAQALVNKTSSRLRDKVRAQETYEKLNSADIAEYTDKALVITYLIETLVDEFLLYSDKEVLKELEEKINELYLLSLNHSNYGLLLTSLVLKVKSLILQNKNQEVSEVFESALQIAEKNNLPKLKEKIINEIESHSTYKGMINLTLEERIEELKIKMYISEAKKVMGYSIDQVN